MPQKYRGKSAHQQFMMFMIKYIVADLSVSSVHKLTHTHTNDLHTHTYVCVMRGQLLCKSQHFSALAQTNQKQII